MKKLFLFLTLFPLWGLATEPVPSKIEKVTVFLHSAQITRSVPCTLAAGSNEIIIAGLSPNVDENSIQIGELGSVSILSMHYDLDYLTPKDDDPEILDFINRIRLSKEAIAQLSNHIEGLQVEEKVLSNNQRIYPDANALDLENVKQVSQYYGKRITIIRNEIYSIQQQISEKEEAQKKLEAELRMRRRKPENPTGKLTLILDAPSNSKQNLQLSYVVNNAGWVPSYDIRSREMGAPVELTYKAYVYQKTGVDWKDAHLVLSTDNPSNNTNAPDLGAHYLNFVSPSYKRPQNSAQKNTYGYNPSVRRVTGVVTDASGTPLPGCNITIKGKTKGTVTDFDGAYTMDIPEGSQNLVFSYIGFKTQEIPVYSSVINVSMEEDAQALQEVVVTGYSTAKTNSITGSVSTINMDNALAGKTAGVRIRGTEVQESTNQPLYVIDGVPVEGYEEGDLDADEIQSVDVFTGVNAMSIFGTGAKNGVVVITTKKSKTKTSGKSIQFEIKKSYTIKADGDITAVEVKTIQLDTEYEYLAAPVVNSNVYLMAKLQGWETEHLLAGEANIYFDGNYAGKTAIDPQTTSKQLQISLGENPNISVERKRLSDYKSKNFVGSNRILDRRYELVIKNNTAATIPLKLMDRIPVSQNKEIKVEDQETGSAQYNKDTGLLTWSLSLKPQEDRTETFGFTVKYPRYQSISL